MAKNKNTINDYNARFIGNIPKIEYSHLIYYDYNIQKIAMNDTDWILFLLNYNKKL